MFEVADFCQATPEVMLGITMAEALAVFVILGLLVLLVFIFQDIRRMLNRAN